MINLDIPKEEQSGVLESFWTMLRELETFAENEDDAILKHWVECWYIQWNRITGQEYKARWEK